MHTQRLTLTLTALASAGLLLTACGTESGAGSETGSGGRSVQPGPPLTGVRWTVDSLTLDGKKYEAPGDAHLKIGKDGRAGGSFGCNSVGADVTIKGDTVEFGEPLLTKRACTDENRMRFEKSVLRALGKEKLTAKVDGARMTLTTAKGDRMAFTSRPDEPDTPLTGTKWTVRAVGDAKSAAPLPKDVADKVHLTFGEDGKVRGNLGCNDVTAEAEAKDGRITFGVPATTRKMCPGATMATERRLLKLFDGPARYVIERDTLKLTAADGTVINASGAAK
ncbi:MULTISPECIES: META domain-containing protein [Streptomyces]|uniref:META domain-containing protein n=1 Tax=Streptomyces TaxID=1883 RepID=UPI001E5086C1|nr:MULTISPECIES: META domain-containing protein [Streptomyces]UFQ16678.1 META domain-containing protein [Streptomyces huasconensis]WCL86279.1 META domain-containing protein [Streptomyces sp. JCM 35825]